MIRCLIADDSRFFRTYLRELLASTPGIEVIAEAASGEEAVSLALLHKPHVVTMDLYMRGKGGLAAIREIKRSTTASIVVISGFADRLGSDDFPSHPEISNLVIIEKPRASEEAESLSAQAELIRNAVRSAAVSALEPLAPAEGLKPSAITHQPPLCIGIVASTGGPEALEQIFRQLPATFPIPIMVVQHIAHGFSQRLSQRLLSTSNLVIHVARHGERLMPGNVYVAPDDAHMSVWGGRIRLSLEPEINGLRPSGTALLSSIAKQYGRLGVGVILTGMGNDGITGLKLLRERGAPTIAQGPKSSVVFGMPRVAIESGAAQHVLELSDIPGALLQLAAKGQVAQAQ